MDGRVVESDGHGQPHGDDQAKEAGEDSGQREVGPVLHPVDLSQHEHGVGEHDEVSARHPDGVHPDGARRHVLEAPRHVEQQLVPAAVDRRLVGDAEELLDQRRLPLHRERVGGVELDAQAAGANNLDINIYVFT